MRMAAKKVSQEALRQMMAKLKADKGEAGKPDLKRKYKLGAKEQALLEQEKRKKVEERQQEKKAVEKKAGVPENFFDSAKTKAFLNLNKAPQKSILKNSSRPNNAAAAREPPKPSSSANVKATGKEWTSSAPQLTAAGKKQKEEKDQKPEMPADFFDSKKEKPAEAGDGGQEKAAEGSGEKEDDTDIPEGFFDDPVKDAKARGLEYRNPEDQEWETFQREIAAEVRESAELAAEEQLEETTGRQLEEIDEQMRAWSRVREAELRKDIVEEKLLVKKEVVKKEEKEESDEELEEEDLEDFLDWRVKKLS